MAESAIPLPDKLLVTCKGTGAPEDFGIPVVSLSDVTKSDWENTSIVILSSKSYEHEMAKEIENTGYDRSLLSFWDATITII